MLMKNKTNELRIDVRVAVKSHPWSNEVRRPTPFVGQEGVIDKDYKDGSFKVQLDDGSFRFFYNDELEVI